MATKLGKVVVGYSGNNSSMKLHDPLITCLPELMSQIKDKISSLQQVYGNRTWQGNELG